MFTTLTSEMSPSAQSSGLLAAVFRLRSLSPRRLEQSLRIPEWGAVRGGIQAFADHDASGLLEPELLLELQGLIAVTACGVNAQ